MTWCLQGVNIGELCEKAIVRRVDSSIGLLLELPLGGASFAGYVHVKFESFLFNVFEGRVSTNLCLASSEMTEYL